MAAGAYNFEEQDYVSDELPGISAFCRDGQGAIYHMYSAYASGAKMPIGPYAMLELTACGRNEAARHARLAAASRSP